MGPPARWVRRSARSRAAAPAPGSAAGGARAAAVAAAAGVLGNHRHIRKKTDGTEQIVESNRREIVRNGAGHHTLRSAPSREDLQKLLDRSRPGDVDDLQG